MAGYTINLLQLYRDSYALPNLTPQNRITPRLASFND